MITRHLVATISADGDMLNDEELIKITCEAACRKAGATILQTISHKFWPQGVTAMVLLSESHMSIHTWPELGIDHVDLFTCGAHTDPKKGLEHLLYQLRGINIDSQVITRTV